MNLLSNDVQRFDLASNYLHYAWIMPIQSILAFYVMYRSVGIAAIAGMAAITIQAIPLQGRLLQYQIIYREFSLKFVINRDFSTVSVLPTFLLVKQ